MPMTMIISIGPRLNIGHTPLEFLGFQSNPDQVEANQTDEEERSGVDRRQKVAARSRSGRVRLLVGRHRLVDFVFDARDPFLEFGHALAQRPHDAGKAIAEDQ